MSEHVRITRNRREFLTDAFCGFGSLAFGAMLKAEQAKAGYVNPLVARLPHIPESCAGEISDLSIYGRRTKSNGDV